MRYRSLAVPAALGLTSLLPAQEELAKDVVVEAQHAATIAISAGPGMLGMAAQNATFQFIASEPGLMGKVVAGAPYSGEGFTEIVQTLADGTRISNKHSKKVWRDSQGRTREETTLTTIGPWSAEGGASHKLITISDPVAKTAYMLNEKDKTATRRNQPMMEAMMAKMAAEAEARVKEMAAEAKARGKEWTTHEQREVVIREGATARMDSVMTAPPLGASGVTFARSFRSADSGKEEVLGAQVMEGLKVEGKRHTNTIKAGEIGNDRELVSVTERWNSTDLQVLVRMTTKDPQMGETTYRLTNISRVEPPAALFQVPADYTVTEGLQQIRFDRTFETKP